MNKFSILRILSKLRFPISPIIKYYKPDLPRRMKILRHYDIDTIFDIGANTGQYATLNRIMGYKGKIISFEPLNDAFQKLKMHSRKDKNWLVNNYALGDKEDKGTINIAKNSYSSSVLDIGDLHLDSAPNSKYIGQQEIHIKRIDAVFHLFSDIDNNIMVKIDTQGFEKNVLDGAVGILDKIKIIQLEMSIFELYEGEILYQEMISLLDAKGFKLISLENGFSNPNTGELLQVDGIFLNKALSENI